MMPHITMTVERNGNQYFIEAEVSILGYIRNNKCPNVGREEPYIDEITVLNSDIILTHDEENEAGELAWEKLKEQEDAYWERK